jgi:hypothetical protein
MVVRELDVRHLKLLPLAAHHRPVFTPVELERFARREHQRHKRAASRCLGSFALPLM